MPTEHYISFEQVKGAGATSVDSVVKQLEKLASFLEQGLDKVYQTIDKVSKPVARGAYSTADFFLHGIADGANPTGKRNGGGLNNRPKNQNASKAVNSNKAVNAKRNNKNAKV